MGKAKKKDKRMNKKTNSKHLCATSRDSCLVAFVYIYTNLYKCTRTHTLKTAAI